MEKAHIIYKSESVTVYTWEDGIIGIEKRDSFGKFQSEIKMSISDFNGIVLNAIGEHLK